MKRTRQPASSNRRTARPAGRRPCVHGSAAGTTAARRSAVRRALWVLGPLAMAVLLILAVAIVGADAARLAPVGLAAVLWTIAASFVQALRQGLRHGDWSAFSGGEPPRNDDDFDFFNRSGTYAYLKIQADHEALAREGDRFLRNHDHLNPL